jgi:hypothetical protein
MGRPIEEITSQPSKPAVSPQGRSGKYYRQSNIAIVIYALAVWAVPPRHIELPMHEGEHDV